MQTQSSILYSELAPLTSDKTCLKLLRYVENIGDKKLPVKHILLARLSKINVF